MPARRSGMKHDLSGWADASPLLYLLSTLPPHPHHPHQGSGPASLLRALGHTELESPFLRIPKQDP